MFQALKNLRLKRAVEKNNLSKVKLLLSNGADVNIKDKKGRSLLAMAYHYNSDSLIDFLLTNGVRQEINRLYSYAKRCMKNNNLLEAKKRFGELQKYLTKDSAVYYYLGSIDYNLGLEENKISGANSKLVQSAKDLKIALSLHDEDLRLDESKLANITLMINDISTYTKH
jgi:ankyrin repeat protein